MKFPSIESLLLDASNVSKRFPLTILFVIFSTIIGLMLIESDFAMQENTELFVRLFASGQIGMVLSIAIELFSESRKIVFSKKIILYVITLLISVIFFLFFLPDTYSNAYLFFILSSGAAHLFVSISGFIYKGTEFQFWEFNKSIFLRIFLSVLYSLVLFAGLAAAIASVDALFSVNFNSKTYGYLGLIILIPFNTFFFLSGIPFIKNKINEEFTEYPNALKLFTQYVLLPLTTIYLAILLAYELKIILTWKLPDGYVSLLILGYAIFGILSLLLIHPIMENKENKWMNYFKRFFYFLMIPILFLFVLAVYKRVSEYGITEERYLLIAIATWLSFITFYFIIKKNADIRLIPSSLFLVLLIANITPINAFISSKLSQQRQLSFALSDSTSQKQKERVIDISNYLIRNHGVSSVQEFVKTDLKIVEAEIKTEIIDKSNNEYSTRYEIQNALNDTILILMGYDSRMINLESKRENYANFLRINPTLINSENTKRIIQLNNNIDFQNNGNYTFQLDNKKIVINADTNNRIIISLDNDSAFIDLNTMNQKIIKELKNLKLNSENNDLNSFDVPDSLMEYTLEIKDYTFILRLNNLETQLPTNKNSKPKIYRYEGFLIVADKK